MLQSAAIVATEMWDCPCGRRVPGHVQTCRCGRARPAAPAPRVHAPLPVSAPSTSIYQSTGLRAVGAFGVMILVFFGSRACNRHVASRDVRQQAEEVLTRSIGIENAKTAMNRYHRACFDETYRTGWGRRQSSKFDEEKYVTCLADRVKKDRQFASSPGEARPTRPEAIPTPVARRLEAGPPRVTVVRVRPGPNPDPAYGSYSIEYRVSGGALPPLVLTNEQVICDGVPLWSQPGHHIGTLGRDGDPSRGEIGAFFRKPAGARTCVFEFSLANEKMQAVTEPQTATLF